MKKLLIIKEEKLRSLNNFQRRFDSFQDLNKRNAKKELRKMIKKLKKEIKIVNKEINFLKEILI